MVSLIVLLAVNSPPGTIKNRKTHWKRTKKIFCIGKCMLFLHFWWRYWKFATKKLDITIVRWVNGLVCNLKLISLAKEGIGSWIFFNFQKIFPQTVLFWPIGKIRKNFLTFNKRLNHDTQMLVNILWQKWIECRGETDE